MSTTVPGSNQDGSSTRQTRSRAGPGWLRDSFRCVRYARLHVHSSIIFSYRLLHSLFVARGGRARPTVCQNWHSWHGFVAVCAGLGVDWHLQYPDGASGFRPENARLALFGTLWRAFPTFLSSPHFSVPDLSVEDSGLRFLASNSRLPALTSPLCADNIICLQYFTLQQVPCQLRDFATNGGIAAGKGPRLPRVLAVSRLGRRRRLPKWQDSNGR